MAWGSHEQRSASQPLSSVDVGFLRDMQAHHAQAVEMSLLVRDRTSDTEVRTLALDIAMGQQHQVGQMYGRLSAEGLPQTTSGPRMGWMANKEPGGDPHGPGHSAVAPGGRMPGMASDDDLRQLGQLSGRNAERLFLQLMIPHHRAGVDMAKYVTSNGSDPQVMKLAASMAAAQTAEITALQDMLETRGGQLP